MRKQANLSRTTHILVMLMVSTLHFLHVNTMVARDAAVLKAVSQAWGLGWNRTEPCSMLWWECSTTGEVTQLNVLGYWTVKAITGSIPESLGDLKNLTYLYLNDNKFTGNIPKSLGNLKNLTVLSLRGNEITGNIPEFLIDLKNLRSLDLSDNNLTGHIPERLGELKGLIELDLSNNTLTGSIPESLGNLTSLKILDLKENKLTGHIRESLGDLKNLTSLDLSENNLIGHIPVRLGKLEGLTLLHLSMNELTGSIPERLGDLKNLKELWLSDNGLTGIIPKSLGNLTSLEFMFLDRNRLTGRIPESLGDLKNLIELGLSNNDLTGSIPESFGNLKSLMELFLSNCSLTGRIPDSLGNLARLSMMDLSNNALTGSIPESLGNLTMLTYLWIEDNFFTSIPSALQYNLPVESPEDFAEKFLNLSRNCIPNANRQRSDTECRNHSAPSPAPTVLAPAPLNWQTPTPSLPPAPSAPASSSWQVPTKKTSSSSSPWWIWLVIYIIAAIIILAAVATAFFLAKRSSKQNPGMDLGSVEISTLTTYTLTEIRSMTHNWGDDNLLGSGGFGSVYKGVIEGQTVAVKKLNLEGVTDNNNATKEFLNEVAILSKVRHKNLVALKGFCCNRGQRILVMEFVSNGNLADHLFYHQRKGFPVLQWSTRLRIATTAAEALHYLHSLNDEKIIHRDIKAENILLDESYNSLVCDFGLAKLTPQLGTETMPTIATRNVAGTKGYMAPEWLIQGILSDKMDVYSFGIVLLELVTGANRFKCFSLGEGPDALYSVHEAAWIVCTTRPDALSLMVDPNIAEGVPPASVISILCLALHCISEERRDRPTMERVVRMLKGMIEVPPLPTEPPSWFQEVDTSIDLSLGQTTLQEICVHEGRESTHDLV